MYCLLLYFTGILLQQLLYGLGMPTSKSPQEHVCLSDQATIGVSACEDDTTLRLGNLLDSSYTK